MSDTNKEESEHLGTKIVNMLDVIIKSDDELENNQMRSSLKFSDDSYSEEEKENTCELFDKDIFSPIDEQNTNKINKNNNNNNNIQNSEFIGSLNNMSQTPTNHFININTNYNQYYYNHLFSPNINNNINNINNINNPYNFNQQQFTLMNHNINNINLISNFNPNFNYNNMNINNNFNNNRHNANNPFQRKNSESMNSISLSTLNDKNTKPSDNMSFISIDSNLNGNSFMNNKPLDNSFYKEGNLYKFKRNRKNHNSFFAGDKIIFNPKIINQNANHKYNPFNKNVEIEILLIEINKILIKLEKISQNCYNKLKGKFEQIIRTHKGSRIFQNYLKNTQIDILHQIFLEIKNKLPELLRDNYANYFCKKFFDCLSQKDRIEYLTIIQNDLGMLAIDVTATYPIQGIIEQLGSNAEKNIIYLGIKDYINIFCYNVYGTHVLEKMLSYFEDKFVQEIIDFVYNNFIDLAYHINGICIVKKLILMTHKKELHEKLKKKIYDNTLNLIVHQYGNYVIQVIMENWEDNELEDIINLCKDKYAYLSNQKFSSNAVERIIEKNNENLVYYINQICSDNNLSEVIKNNYGNYVIQKAVKLSSGKSQEKLIEEIAKNLHKLEDKKIINKWRMIISMANF